MNGYLAKWAEPRVILLVVGLLAAGIGWYFTVSGHCSDQDVHHTTLQLDERYVNEDMYARDCQDHEQSLARIERKLDKVADKLGIVP